MGRNADKLEAAGAQRRASARWTTDLDAALSDPTMSVYFDAQTTLQRAAGGHEGHRGGQAHLLREAHGHEHRAKRYDLYAPARKRGREARRGAGQAVAARPA